MDTTMKTNFLSVVLVLATATIFASTQTQLTQDKPWRIYVLGAAMNTSDDNHAIENDYYYPDYPQSNLIYTSDSQTTSGKSVVWISGLGGDGLGTVSGNSVGEGFYYPYTNYENLLENDSIVLDWSGVGNEYQITHKWGSYWAWEGSDFVNHPFNGTNSPNWPRTISDYVSNEHCSVADPQPPFWEYLKYTSNVGPVLRQITRTGTYQRYAQAVWHVQTGGKAMPGRQNLWQFSGGAQEVLDKRGTPPWSFVPTREITNKTQIVLGSLGHLKADGTLWLVLPDNLDKDITPTVTGMDFYKFSVGGQKYNISAPNVAVDMNRNGSIDFNGSDVTSVTNPYCFWLNNNHDGYGTIGGDSVQVDLGGNDDMSSSTISCTRDLEDYTRLGIRLNNVEQKLLTNGTVVVKLESEPQIQIFRATGGNSTAYLTDSNTAQQQISAPFNQALGSVGSYQFPPSFWTNFPTAYFLFDGISGGKGNMKVSLYASDERGTLTKFSESDPTYVNLQDVKKMYDTWTLNNPSTSTASGSSVYNSSSPQTGQYILFVHGWNMTSDDKDHFANTAYKRLWWQGYKGRFGAFDWPTLTGLTTYDSSEYNAWKSATALANKLSDLDTQYTNNVYLFAHSMGNVVAGEALRLNNTNGNGVQAYVACQAAVPAHAYDTQTADWTPIFGSTYDTPDDFANYPPTHANYFNNVTSGGSRANFYNTNDYALGWWVTNQRTKPDNATAPAYHWVTPSSTHPSGYYRQISTFETDLYYPTNAYEIFAYGVQSPCYALGATPNVGGFGNVNLSGIWNYDPFTSNPNSKFSDHCWHSAEFYFSTVEQSGWWSSLKNSLFNH